MDTLNGKDNFIKTMKTNQTFISLKEIREFYKERCEDERKFSEKSFV